MKKSKKIWVTCKGGPWSGHKLLIPLCGTYQFKLGGHRGKYDSTGKWNEL